MAILTFQDKNKTIVHSTKVSGGGREREREHIFLRNCVKTIIKSKKNTTHKIWNYKIVFDFHWIMIC